jgi:hypothetical protein
MTYTTVYLESAAALAAGEPIANLVSTNFLFRVRRIMIGVRTVSDATPVDQLLTVALTPSSARGTETSSLNFGPLDTFAASNPAGVTADVAWSTNPTFSTSVGEQMYGFSLNTHFPLDVKWAREEAPVTYVLASGGLPEYNGIVLWNVGADLPTDHIYAVTIQIEE